MLPKQSLQFTQTVQLLLQCIQLLSMSYSRLLMPVSLCLLNQHGSNLNSAVDFLYMQSNYERT